MWGPGLYTDNLIRRYGGVQIYTQYVADIKLCSSKPQKGKLFQMSIYWF